MILMSEETNQDYADNYKNWKNVCKEIAEDLEETNPNRKSIEHLVNAVNWMLSISAATLAYLSINYDKVIIYRNLNEAYIPNKTIFILIIIFFSVSTIIFLILKAILLYRGYKIATSLDFIYAIPDLNERADSEGLWKQIEGWEGLPDEKRIDLKTEIWENSWQDEFSSCYNTFINSLNYSGYIFIAGIIFYGFGISLLAWFSLKFLLENY